MEIKPQDWLWAGRGGLYFYPLMSGWLLFRFAERNLSLLIWEQAGKLQDLLVSEPLKHATTEHATVTTAEVTCHIPDRVCVSVLPSATVSITKLLEAPPSEIHLADEMLPTQIFPGLIISLERSKVRSGDGYVMWPSQSVELTYPIEGTRYVVRGRISLRDFVRAIPLTPFPCVRVRVEWNSRILSPITNHEEQWALTTSLESVTKTDDGQMISLVRT